MPRKELLKDAVDLRKRAEERVRNRAAESREDLGTLSPKEIRKVVHELRVHQVELEMQNDELRQAHVALQASRARYFDLYDLAPVGYFTLSKEGLILEGNIAAATLLGVARGALAKKRISQFIIKEDQDVYYLHRKLLVETGEPQSCELRLKGKSAMPVWARLQLTVAEDERGESVSRLIMLDITARKEAEEERSALEHVFRMKPRVRR